MAPYNYDIGIKTKCRKDNPMYSIIQKFFCCNIWLKESTENRDPSGIANSNCMLGDAYHSLGEYKKAIEHYEKGLEILTTIGSLSEIASTNTNLGNAYFDLAKYRKAIEYYETGRKINITIDDPARIAHNNRKLSNAYRYLGEYEKAISYSKRSLEISRAIGDQSALASSNRSLGSIYLCKGECEEAIGYCKKALEISTKIEDQSEIACINSILGSAYRRLGDYEKAFHYHKNSLKFKTAVGDQSGIAGANSNLGNIYNDLGEYGKAIDHHKKALENNTANGDRLGIATNNCNLGNVYLHLADYKKAINHFQNGLENSTAVGDQLGIATSNGNLGNAYLKLDEYEKAINCYNKGLEISTKIGNRPGIAYNNSNLGSAYLSLREYEKAINYFQVGLEICTEIGDQLGIAASNGCLGIAYNYLEKYEKAIHYLETGLTINTSIGDEIGKASKNANLGIAYKGLGKYEMATLYLMKSISFFDRIFLKSVPDQNKFLFTIQYFSLHEILMRCFIALERIESGLLVIDLGRAKELHCWIEKQHKSVEKDIFGYANAIWKRIENREERLETERMHKFFQVEGNKISILVFAFDKEDFLNVWVLNGKVIYRSPKSDSRWETFVRLINTFLGRVNVSVNRDSSFYKLDSGTNPNSQRFISLEMPSKKTAPKKAIENLSDLSGDLSDRKILERLYQLLIDPVKDVVKGNKLIIVPDKQLFFAPFSSLIDENGCYLSHDYSIQITPSLHTLKSSIERSNNSNFGFALFVGNPTVGKVSLNGEEFTPSDLPSAAAEVRCLSKLFEASPLLGPKATKQVVLQLLSDASIIHIAAHGEPDRGEIMLAPNPSLTQPLLSVPNPESYLLTQRDIMSISLKARLVVLCCCHTGQGDISSEGVIGLTRAFLAAGARSVLATLWPINDRATKEFMDKFYKELFQEKSVCEALKRTMNIFQKHEEVTYQSTTIWAPFTIYGEDVKFQKHELEKIKVKCRETFPPAGKAD